MADLVLFICGLVIARGVWIYVIKPFTSPLSEEDGLRIAEQRRARELFNDNSLNS